MTTPLLSLAEITAAQTAAYLKHNEALRKLEGAVQAAVVNDTTTAPPGSPAEGDRYIIAATATGAWAGKEKQLALYTNGAWVYLVPAEGWLVWDRADDHLLVYNGTAWSVYTPSSSGTIYDFGMSKSATPTSSEIIGDLVVARAITVPANMAGSYGAVTTNPTSSFAIDVQDDGVSIGTITIGTGGAFTFATTSGTAKAIAAGSRLQFIAPASVDATVAGIVVAVAATVT